jgi:hypothetical protein
MTQPEDQLDPRLRDLFEQLRPTPPRDPLRATRGRANFLGEVEALGPPVSPGPIRRLIKWINSIDLIPRQEGFSMASIVALLLSIVLFLGGAGVTTHASQAALPGDTLYGVKTTLEGAQLKVSLTPDGDFDLHMRFAAERLEEIQSLAAEGRHEDIEAAVDLLEDHLEAAAEAMSVVAESDPALAEALANRYRTFVEESWQVIAALASSASPDTRDALEDALEVLDEASGDPGEDLDMDQDELDELDEDDVVDGIDDGDLDEPDDDDDVDGIDSLDEPDHDDDVDDIDDDDLDEPDGDDDVDNIDDDDLDEPDDDDGSDDSGISGSDEPDDDDGSDDTDGSNSGEPDDDDSANDLEDDSPDESDDAGDVDDLDEDGHDD